MEKIINSKTFYKLDKVNPSKEYILLFLESLSSNYDGIQFLSNVKEMDYKDLFIDLIKIPSSDEINVYINYEEWGSKYEKIESDYIPLVNLPHAKIRLDYKNKESSIICYKLKSDSRKEIIRESNFLYNGNVYIKLFSGEIIPFYCNINDSLKELGLKISDKLNVETTQILFFDKYEPIKNLEIKIKYDFVYNVFIKDFVVKISFDRTIRIKHKYSKMPKRAILEIVNLTDKAYRYIYNELYYVSRGDGDFFLNNTFVLDINEDIEEEQLFINFLKKYDIEPFPDDKDFTDIDEKTKLNLISAYLFECVSISLDIISYVFISI